MQITESWLKILAADFKNAHKGTYKLNIVFFVNHGDQHGKATDLLLITIFGKT